MRDTRGGGQNEARGAFGRINYHCELKRESHSPLTDLPAETRLVAENCD